MSTRVESRDAAAWRLFTDWCAAVGVSPLPATVGTVAAFFDQVPASEGTLRARLRVIRRAHQRAGQVLGIGYEPSPTAWRSGPGWLSLGAALARCEVGGWPSAVRGRRDAFLLVAIGLVGLTRSQAVRLSVDDITWPTRPTSLDPIRIKGKAIEPTPGAADCPACAVTRWLRVATEQNRWGRSSVRQMLATHPSTATSHDCADGPPQGWREVWQLAPAVDQHGWFADWRPMSTRAVSTVLATRLADRTVRPTPPPEVERPEWDDYEPDETRPQVTDEAELWALLEEKVAAADAANSRIDAILADTESFLGSISTPAPAVEEAPEE